MSAPSAPDLKSSFDQRRARIFRPVVIVSVVALVLLAVIAMRLVASNDREAREHEQAMVERGLALRMHELEQGVIPQVEWDEAVDHLGNRLDRPWADAYFTVFMHSQVGATRASCFRATATPPMPRATASPPMPRPMRSSPLSPPPPRKCCRAAPARCGRA
jgi:hypothetical protein